MIAKSRYNQSPFVQSTIFADKILSIHKKQRNFQVKLCKKRKKQITKTFYYFWKHFNWIGMKNDIRKLHFPFDTSIWNQKRYSFLLGNIFYRYGQYDKRGGLIFMREINLTMFNFNFSIPFQITFPSALIMNDFTIFHDKLI